MLAAALLAIGAAAFVVGSANRSNDAVEIAGALADSYSVWEHTAGGTPVRWDPCSPLTIVVDSTDAPPAGRQDLDVAVEMVAEVTGLDIEVAGETEERPAGNRPAYQPERYGERWAPILVSWAPAGHNGVALEDSDRAVALPVAVGDEGEQTYVTGQLVLNAAHDDLNSGFDDRATSWGAVLLHELGHLVGLGHTEDPGELMHGSVVSGPVEFGPGDRAGLRAVGSEAGGCIDVPEPGPVNVARSTQVQRH